MLPFARVAIIGMGLIGSSLARAIRAAMPTVQLVVSDADEDVRERVIQLGLADDVTDGAGAAVVDADLVILCVPVGAMAAVAAEIGPELSPDTVVSDVGSVKESVAKVLGAALPGVHVIPAHPVAGTEKSGPDAGFASLFQGRWCIITPPPRADAMMVEKLAEFWRRLGARVELMDAAHHDRVLAVTSHLPHLIAYSIVGTASDLEAVTKAEVIKYSAGGFRDFTRIAASDPVMWRDVFLNNREAVLELLGRFTEDLVALQRAIRWGEGDTLEALFTRTRAIRRSIIDEGQDTEKADFGR
ncbi:cyclohexadienyl dehydrogenase [Sandarakinorhabdus cyanobacteriorum]|uniref:prephenate dehydrogenase n=1 Tax=Sandarakinorhabdus cyanobacteriorum TaxID=1981098 RepID=A0A255YPC9_9SPHN|nr:prephenate/arogenate dehydrogenase family protein [Sandarakinorhabdus cyanobacteriorum]OYQ31059.1 cyclohexadienyl dehydrogenase [Sandarakinorhabdus cyanobacteriorum]